MDAYDSIPYDRLAIAETHPDQLAVLARLHGLTPADPRACRVLELGCASGGNLLPMAWHLPESRFTGIDLSSSQVQTGQDLVAELGLNNLEIRQADAGDPHLGERKYDFIIAHGLYSWVPEATRTALLRVIRAHLDPAGIAYLSFNALPGWRMRGMLRDMLLYHVRDLAGPRERLAAARAFLPWLDGCLQDLDALSARYLRHELGLLVRAPDSYLYHEYLAAENNPQTFTDFVASVGHAGLRYLCNAELHYQFPAALGDRVESGLAGISDPGERQQYLDFLLNRNFHQALLVPQETCPEAEPDYERFADLAFYADLRPPRKLDLRQTKTQQFCDVRGDPHPVSHPLTKAAVAHLTAVYPRAVAYPELEAIATGQVRAAGNTRLAAQGDHLFGELFHLFAHRAVLGSLIKGNRPAGPGERPAAGRLATMESRFGRLVDSRHATWRVDAAIAGIIADMDGSRSREELADRSRAPQAGRDLMPLDALLALLTRQGAFA